MKKGLNYLMIFKNGNFKQQQYTSMLKCPLLSKQWQKLVFYIILLLCASCKTLTTSPAKLVDWHSVEGIKRLSNSRHRADFSRLASQFQNQIDRFSCGPVTGAIVLNALRIGKADTLPKTNFDERYRAHLRKDSDPRVARYTPESFMSEKAQKIKSLGQIYGQLKDGKSAFGVAIRKLHKMFLTHGVKSKLRLVNKELSNQHIRKELISNLGRAGDYVVVNYKRSALGQKGGGHFSPLGAYDENTDSFLIMDVNSSQHNWAWVKADQLISAMRTLFTVENRGYLLIKE